MSMAQGSIFDPQPALQTDPQPSASKAAVRARPAVGSETWDALELIYLAGYRGISNREIQMALHEPYLPAWNKVATRTKWLRDHGYARLGVDETGEVFTRTSSDGVSTIINFITSAGTREWLRLHSDRT